MKIRIFTLTASLLFGSALASNLNAIGPTVSGVNITPLTDLVAEGGFTLDLIHDGITGNASSFNGFVSNTLGTISFNFDQDYDLTSFILWNDVVVANEGLNEFSLVFFDSLDSVIAPGFTADYIGPKGQVAAEEYLFATTVQGVRRVDLVVNSVQSTVFTTRVEIREVDFGVVPEPSTYALLAGMIALFATVLRRKR